RLISKLSLKHHNRRRKVLFLMLAPATPNTRPRAIHPSRLYKPLKWALRRSSMPRLGTRAVVVAAAVGENVRARKQAPLPSRNPRRCQRSRLLLARFGNRAEAPLSSQSDCRAPARAPGSSATTSLRFQATCFALFYSTIPPNKAFKTWF